MSQNVYILFSLLHDLQSKKKARTQPKARFNVHPNEDSFDNTLRAPTVPLWTDLLDNFGDVNIPSSYQTVPEKTREVTRLGQAGLTKIMSLSAVLARRVTTHE